MIRPIQCRFCGKWIKNPQPATRVCCNSKCQKKRVAAFTKTYREKKRAEKLANISLK